MKKTFPRREDGQILNCAYGYHWPLDRFVDGYVQIRLKITRRGKVKINYVWAKTRSELA